MNFEPKICMYTFTHCGDSITVLDFNDFWLKVHKYFFLLQDKLRRPEVDYGPVRNDPRCGLNAASRSVAQRRIVGGSEAGFGSFPWQAYIRIGMIYLRHHPQFFIIASAR